MEMRDLLEKMMKFAGEKVGQKPGDQWRGSDKAPAGKKLVGDSILKDLSKGPTAKSKEQELAEEFQAFLEAEFKDTIDKRPSRKGARHSRGHEPQPGYKTVKTDEAVGEQQVAEGVPYKATNPHPALQDPVVANVLKQMRPGLTGLDMNNEAFLYFAYELGKDRARGMWEDYGPAIKYFYQSGIGVNEGWESGPEEYKEPYDDADDAYERQRQEKIDTEAEKEWAKLPKVSTYKLLGRGPNMEPNYEFDGKEYDTLEAAIEARKELMADPKTPHPEHIGIQTLTRVVDKEQTQSAEESRGHKIIATKLKDIERAKKFASGELNIPTPQERQTQLKKLEKEKSVKEYGASSPGATSSAAGTTTTTTDPKELAKVAQATQTLKAATGTTAPTTNITKAIDAASQGKGVNSTDMKVLEPLMKDVATVAQDPKLAGQFKSILQQVNQTQMKQQK